MSGGLPELGSKISLISKADIRYEGRLYTVDPQECTIALSSGKWYYPKHIYMSVYMYVYTNYIFLLFPPTYKNTYIHTYAILPTPTHQMCNVCVCAVKLKR